MPIPLQAEICKYCWRERVAISLGSSQGVNLLSTIAIKFNWQNQTRQYYKISTTPDLSRHSSEFFIPVLPTQKDSFQAWQRLKPRENGFLLQVPSDGRRYKHWNAGLISQEKTYHPSAKPITQEIFRLYAESNNIWALNVKDMLIEHLPAIEKWQLYWKQMTATQSWNWNKILDHDIIFPRENDSKEVV